MAKKQTKAKKMFIIRSIGAGVFYGEIKSRKGQEVEMRNARRLWYWAGAASLSQLANEGVKKPGECRFPAAVASVIVTQAVEILETTKAAQKSIEAVQEWRI